MLNKKFTNILCIFMLLQPIYDIFIYYTNDVLNISLGFTSLVRPLLAGILFLYLVFSDKKNMKFKMYSFIYLVIYLMYVIIHLLHIRGYFYNESSGSLGGEFRYLITYGYYLLQLINFCLVFKKLDVNDKNKILKYLVYTAILVASCYFVSIITKTSPTTYTYPSIKEGWKGWSVSSHYVGHVLTYLLPVVLYALFEKKLFNKYLSYAIVVFVIVPGVYLIGTKTPLFVQGGLIVGYFILLLLKDIFKNKKINLDTIFFGLLVITLALTFKFTFGYDNFYHQKQLSEDTSKNFSEVIEDVNHNNQLTFNKNPDVFEPYNLKVNLYQRLELVVKDRVGEETAVFDNREVQKEINKGLVEYSTISDRFFGYGHDTLPKFMWVETDAWTIYYCYGWIGFLLLIVIPLCPIAFAGIKCLIDYKRWNTAKLILGAASISAILIIFEVGYTLQFAQTSFYYIILLIISRNVFLENNEERKKKKYLFAINDLSMGGAEVGLVDVVNELSKTETVDLVLLRKRGELLDKVNKNVNIYEILNSNYNPVKRKIYHILYFMGGIFTKYVYKQTIDTDYEVEVAYLEGYPAIFIANSTNEESVKIASIRVGLKNHKLNAQKIPLGMWHLKNAYEKMDSIYAVSLETTNEFIERFSSCEDKVSTIYTYFNIEDMKNKAKEKMDFKFDKNCYNFLAVGRFNEQKAYIRLVEAFEEVYKNNPKVRLHFIGKNDTEYGNQVINLIKEKNLDKVITLHGIIKNPYPYMSSCNCLVSSSLYEGFPRVINEALALGKLCVGTNVTGTKEALHEGKLGLLVEDSKEGLIKGMNEASSGNVYEKYKDEIKQFDGNKKSFFESFNKLCIRKKNMIIYMPKLSIGGMEKALVNLINHAKLNDNYNLTLYLLYKGDPNYIHLLPKNIKLIIGWKHKWNIIGKICGAFSLCLRYIYHMFIKYDIAISYSYQHLVLLNLTRFASDNSILYIHSNITQAVEKEKLNKILKKRKYEKFKKIICVSNDSKEALVKNIDKKDNIFVINNPIDGERILSLANEKVEDFKFAKNKVYFVNVSRHMEKYKRLTRIIDATKKLNKEGYKFEVLFVGSGEDSNYYAKLIKEQKIENINMLGNKTNPYPYIKNSNAFLLSSSREGYPVVFIESLVLNKPIVTTSVSDARIDIDKKYGIVVENDDDSIYEGMKEFLDKEFKIKDKFDFEKFNQKIVEDTYNVYEGK